MLDSSTFSRKQYKDDCEAVANSTYFTAPPTSGSVYMYSPTSTLGNGKQTNSTEI